MMKLLAMLVLCVSVHTDEGPYVTRQPPPPPALNISSIQASSVSGVVSIVKTVLHCLRENDSNFSMVLSAFSPNLHTTTTPLGPPHVHAWVTVLWLWSLNQVDMSLMVRYSFRMVVIVIESPSS